MYHLGAESENQEELYQKIKRRKNQSGLSSGGGGLSGKAPEQRPMQQLPATAIGPNQQIR